MTVADGQGAPFSLNHRCVRPILPAVGKGGIPQGRTTANVKNRTLALWLNFQFALLVHNDCEQQVTQFLGTHGYIGLFRLELSSLNCSY